MAQDTIEVLKVLLTKKALIKRSRKSFEEELFCRPLDQNFAVLTVILTTDQPVRSVRVTQVAIKVLQPVYPEKTLINENFEYVLPVENFRISAFRDPNFTILTELLLVLG